MHIDGYEFGRIVIDGKTYTQDLILTPEGVQADWWRLESHRLQLPDIAAALATKPQVLIVGTGQPGRLRVDPELSRYLAEQGIELVELPTAQACQRYNLLASRQRVVAAFHLTC